MNGQPLNVGHTTRPPGDRGKVIATPAHDRAAQRLLAANGSSRDLLAALDPGFDLDDLGAYVWSGAPSLPERYVPLVTGMAAALILLGYELGAERHNHRLGNLAGPASMELGGAGNGPEAECATSPRPASTTPDSTLGHDETDRRGNRQPCHSCGGAADGIATFCALCCPMPDRKARLSGFGDVRCAGGDEEDAA